MDKINKDIDKKGFTKLLEHGGGLFALSLVAFVVYYFLYVEVFNLKTPRRVQLEERAAMLDIRQKNIEEKMHSLFYRIEELNERDNSIYRSSFGIEAVDTTVVFNHSISQIYDMIARLEHSYHIMEPMAESAGKMSACGPSIPPVFLNKIHITSRFGVRSDPMNGAAKVHSGVDLAGKQGTEIYATGDGQVEKVDIKFTGYGNEIVINHGFGYKSRYAHLHSVLVHQGDRVKRGDKIAYMGSTGKSTGPHLHYEVEYMGRKVNPFNFFDSNISSEEYSRLIREESK